MYAPLPFLLWMPFLGVGPRATTSPSFMRTIPDDTTQATAAKGEAATSQPEAGGGGASVMAALHRTYDEEGFQALFRGAWRRLCCGWLVD